MFGFLLPPLCPPVPPPAGPLGLTEVPPGLPFVGLESARPSWRRRDVLARDSGARTQPPASRVPAPASCQAPRPLAPCLSDKPVKPGIGVFSFFFQNGILLCWTRARHRWIWGSNVLHRGLKFPHLFLSYWFQCGFFFFFLEKYFSFSDSRASHVGNKGLFTRREIGVFISA